MSGTLFVVATPIGNLEDVSGRALRILREVALIAAEDTRRTGNLLARYGITTRTTSLHEHNEHGKAEALIERLKAGDDVALVSDAGTPTVSDPGTHVITRAVEEGIRVEPIPGPSAIVTALSVAGLRDQTFTFLGFPPTRSSDRSEWLEQVRTAGRTVVFFESPHRLRATLEDLLRAVGDQAVLIARELTKAHEELVRGPTTVVLERAPAPRGEFTVVLDIGQLPAMERLDAATPTDLAAEFGELTKNRA